MKANELRIGNYIVGGNLYEGRELTVSQVTLDVIFFFNGIAGEYTKDCEPINITPEWLERFGWIKRTGINNPNPWYEKTEGTFSLQWAEDERYDVGLSLPNDYTAFQCKYIHQLQNLYFALAGKELQLTSQKQAAD